VVLAAAAGLLGLVAEVGWLLASRLFATTRGTSTVPAGTWGPLVTSASRGVVLVVLAGLLGFGVANVFRSTAAALGVGFVYFAVLETVVRVVRPTWQRWLITDNAVALLRRGGRTIVTNDASTNTQGVSEPSGHAIVSNLHGGLLIAVVATVLTAAGILLFVRRDVD
jgi:hypothetical protein